MVNSSLLFRVDKTLCNQLACNISESWALAPTHLELAFLALSENLIASFDVQKGDKDKIQHQDEEKLDL